MENVKRLNSKVSQDMIKLDEKLIKKRKGNSENSFTGFIMSDCVPAANYIDLQDEE